MTSLADGDSPGLSCSLAHPEKLSGQSRAVDGTACPVVAEALRVVGVHMRQEMRCNGRSTLQPRQRASNCRVDFCGLCRMRRPQHRKTRWSAVDEAQGGQ